MEAIQHIICEQSIRWCAENNVPKMSGGKLLAHILLSSKLLPECRSIGCFHTMPTFCYVARNSYPNYYVVGTCAVARSTVDVLRYLHCFFSNVVLLFIIGYHTTCTRSTRRTWGRSRAREGKSIGTMLGSAGKKIVSLLGSALILNWYWSGSLHVVLHSILTVLVVRDNVRGKDK